MRARDDATAAARAGARRAAAVVVVVVISCWWPRSGMRVWAKNIFDQIPDVASRVSSRRRTLALSRIILQSSPRPHRARQLLGRCPSGGVPREGGRREARERVAARPSPPPAKGAPARLRREGTASKHRPFVVASGYGCPNKILRPRLHQTKRAAAAASRARPRIITSR